MPNEATARLKINYLLESAGWRFFPEEDKPANVRLEAHTTLQKVHLDSMGDDFEGVSAGYIDFLLLDSTGFPLAVLEAKSEKHQPLVGKEQARKYARSKNCRLVILSNGNLHYFWDLDRGNPHIITSFPAPDSVSGYSKTAPDANRLFDEIVRDDYIVLTQRANYASEAAWLNEAERPNFVRSNNLRFLRDYQVDAVHALQRAVKEGNDRFLFEMATGTGKTTVAAAIIKLFLRTRNANRVLFLVDRLELEDQGRNAFRDVLSNDFTTVVYKENRHDWNSSQVVVSTVQSLLFNNKYQALFSPTDFDFVISDEAHRSIGGNARAVFDYFVGYKLGLTATPRDYLHGVDNLTMSVFDPRQLERRLLRDTYTTFGCQPGHPTFSYTLLDGVKDAVLVNPTVVDARTEVTTKLLSEEGFFVALTDENAGEELEETYSQRDYERRFFSDDTNRVMCQTFLENALLDPISGEIGKSIVFAVSQNHAARLTNTLNEIAHAMFPGKYNSDFAVQVTSQVADAQEFTRRFANNNLMGRANFLPDYRTSKARVCVTVGMMTTGYDCPDLLNLGLFRPIFSPTDFVQIKGRGTRLHDFRKDLTDEALKEQIADPHKTNFKLFDFFANCEYFEEDFNYDQVLQLPSPSSRADGADPGQGGAYSYAGSYEHLGQDSVTDIRVQHIGPEGMRIDRMYLDKFADTVVHDGIISDAVYAGEWERAVNLTIERHFDKPEEYYNLDKLRRSTGVDRRITFREILEKAFGLIPHFKSKDELLEEEFDKFVAVRKPEESDALPVIKDYFKAYLSSDQFRHIIDNGLLTALATNPGFTIADFRAVPGTYRTLIPEYIKDYVSLNRFTS